MNTSNLKINDFIKEVYNYRKSLEIKTKSLRLSGNCLEMLSKPITLVKNGFSILKLSSLSSQMDDLLIRWYAYRVYLDQLMEVNMPTISEKNRKDKILFKTQKTVNRIQQIINKNPI